MANKSVDKDGGGIGGLLKGVKDFWIEPEGEGKGSTKSEPQTAPAKVVVTQPVVTPVFSVQQSTTGADPEFVARIRANILQKAAATPYKAFQEALVKLAPVISDEETRYKAAMATSAIKPQDILNGIDLLLTSLEEEGKLIDATLTEKTGSSLGVKKNSLEALTIEHDGTQKQIETLQAKLSELSKKRTALEAEISEDQNKAAINKMKADAALNEVRSTLAAERAKVDNYVKGA